MDTYVLIIVGVVIVKVILWICICAARHQRLQRIGEVDFKMFSIFAKGKTNASNYDGCVSHFATSLDPSYVSLCKVLNARKPFAKFEEIRPSFLVPRREDLHFFCQNSFTHSFVQLSIVLV